MGISKNFGAIEYVFHKGLTDLKLTNSTVIPNFFVRSFDGLADLWPVRLEIDYIRVYRMRLGFFGPCLHQLIGILLKHRTNRVQKHRLRSGG